MFSFFQKKIFLVDYLHGLVDIHNHILPGIDDGAKTIKTSIALIKGFSSIGVKNFVCTPHIMNHYYPNTPETIKNSFDKLEKALVADEIDDIQIDYAAEHMIDDAFEELLDNNSILPLRNGHLLVEMSYLQPPINFNEAIEKIKVKGFHPVLAHPERYGYLHQEMDKYALFKKNNIHFQLNLLSLSEYYGTQIKKVALKLLDNDFFDYVASDAHNLRHLEHIKELTVDKKRLDQVLAVMNNTIKTFG